MVLRVSPGTLTNSNEPEEPPEIQFSQGVVVFLGPELGAVGVPVFLPACLPWESTLTTVPPIASVRFLGRAPKFGCLMLTHTNSQLNICPCKNYKRPGQALSNPFSHSQHFNTVSKNLVFFLFFFLPHFYISILEVILTCYSKMKIFTHLCNWN